MITIFPKLPFLTTLKIGISANWKEGMNVGIPVVSALSIISGSLVYAAFQKVFNHFWNDLILTFLGLPAFFVFPPTLLYFVFGNLESGNRFTIEDHGASTHHAYFVPDKGSTLYLEQSLEKRILVYRIPYYSRKSI